jgi:hypothetical protein
MKKYSLQLLFAFIAATSLFSCTKNEITNGIQSGTVGANGLGAVTWVEGGGGAGTPIVCDSAYASAQYKSIFVYKGATTTRYFFEINLTSLAPAIYSLSTSGNAVAYDRPGSSGNSTGGGSITVIINANNKLSGTGIVSIPSINDRVYITIKDLPIRP